MAHAGGAQAVLLSVIRCFGDVEPTLLRATCALCVDYVLTCGVNPLSDSGIERTSHIGDWPRLPDCDLRDSRCADCGPITYVCMVACKTPN